MTRYLICCLALLPFSQVAHSQSMDDSEPLKRKQSAGSFSEVCREPYPVDIGQPDPRTIDASIGSIRDYIQMRVTESKIAGLSVGFSYQGKAWSEGFGYADLKKRKPATAKTSYRMASVTKTFTAVAILQLVEKGQLSLDDEVQKYVPSFPQKKYAVTVRDLLGHLSGISHYRNCDDECHIKRRLSTKQALAIFKDWELEAPPREKYVYTSYGYNLLGAVIEGVTGQSYGAYLAQNIFRPLKMNDSFMDYERTSSKTWARGYRKKGERLVPSEKIDISSRFAGGGSRSTVEDMLRFGEGLLDQKLVSQASLHRMMTSMFTSDGLSTKYGMGVAVYPLAGRLVAGHSGGQPETTTLLFMYPHEGLVIALASNVEEQWNLLYDVTAKIGETLLNMGVRRRGGQGTNVRAQYESNALTGIFGHGLARFKHDERFGDSPGDTNLYFRGRHTHTLDAFQRTRDVLKASLSADHEAFANIEKGAGPSMKEAFSVVGDHMAKTIIHACGRPYLERYHVEGPFLFFQDYVNLCGPADCPNAYLFHPDTNTRIHQLAHDWRTSYPAAAHGLRVEKEADVSTLMKLLKEQSPDVNVRPDMSGPLLHYAEKWALEGKVTEAEELSSMAYGLYPMEPKVLAGHAEVLMMQERWDDAAHIYQEAFALYGGEKRLSPLRLRLRAMVLKRHGFKEAAHQVIDVGTRLYPEEASLWDALAASHRKHQRFQEALEAYETAERFQPGSASRKKHIRRLTAKIAKEPSRAAP